MNFAETDRAVALPNVWVCRNLGAVRVNSQKRGIFNVRSPYSPRYDRHSAIYAESAICHAGTTNARFHSVMPLATCLATVLEKRRPLPADAMIPDPIFSSTHAITIDAPPEQVWPWIAQMGSGRAGWYSWDAIDNGGRPSATRIVPAFQTVVPGDIMPAVPGATDAFVVAAVDPPRDLVLTVPDGRGGNAVAWEHVLESLACGRTRLIVRGRASLSLARSR